jgi:chromate reductase
MSTPSPLPLLALSGSLRRLSFNTALLRAAAELMPPGSTLDVRTLHGIPPYDGDLEDASGIPPAVTALKDAAIASRGLLIATPEYNQSIPGVLKNAIDWMTRPPDDAARVFRGKAVALMGATPGAFGTITAQYAWLPVLKTLGTRPWFEGTLRVSRAHECFDAEGKLVDAKVREQLSKFMRGFVAYAESAAAG